ncbi:MAG: hypothetical protein J4452_01890 [Candidatus Aenigmarchaeota archaeon]|nr:hypothetical protein [Candidatus Aenigmarchaeota archaeon]
MIIPENKVIQNPNDQYPTTIELHHRTYGLVEKEDGHYSAKRMIEFWRSEWDGRSRGYEDSGLALHITAIPLGWQKYGQIPEGWRNSRVRGRLENRIGGDLEVPLKVVPIEVNPTYTPNEFRRQIDTLVEKSSSILSDTQMFSLELNQLLISGWAIVNEELYHQLFEYGIQKSNEKLATLPQV